MAKKKTGKKKSSSSTSSTFDSQWKKFRKNLGSKWDHLKDELDVGDVDMDDFLSAIDSHVKEGRKTLKKSLQNASDKL